MGNTLIEWTATVHADGSVTAGKTWNPVTGCDKVSAGCKNCYAEGVANRFWATQYPAIRIVAPNRAGILIAEDRPRTFTDVLTHEDRLTEPLRWRKPAKVFVNSMSDLFHEDVPDAFIDRVFAVMALCPQHTFQILTKRPERMRDYILTLTGSVERMDDLVDEATDIAHDCMGSTAWLQDRADGIGGNWPLPNVWLGVSCENQATADERIPLLLQTPAAVRFISAEPLLGPVKLEPFLPWKFDTFPKHIDRHGRGFNANTDEPNRLDWVIVGGESGPGARPCDVAWVRSSVQQCRSAGVPVFVKQLGSDPRDAAAQRDDMGARDVWPAGWMPTVDGQRVWRPDLTDRKGGDTSEWPENLRVREFPR